VEVSIVDLDLLLRLRGIEVGKGLDGRGRDVQRLDSAYDWCRWCNDVEDPE